MIARRDRGGRAGSGSREALVARAPGLDFGRRAETAGVVGARAAARGGEAVIGWTGAAAAGARAPSGAGALDEALRDLDLFGGLQSS